MYGFSVRNVGFRCCASYAYLLYRTTALGIGGERGIELCEVERSTEAIAEPRKARPLAHITEKNVIFCRLGARGNAQIKKKSLYNISPIIKKAFSLSQENAFLYRLR
jgi:hypothetical protein